MSSVKPSPSLSSSPTIGNLLLTFLLLQTPAVLPSGGAVPMPLIRSIDLDAKALLNEPVSLLAADTLALRVESSREAYYKLSERGEVLAAGELLPGSNSLRFTRPGLSARSQSLFFLLDLLENGKSAQKNIRVMVTVEGKMETDSPEREPLSGSFTLGMYHAKSLIGFREKSMGELLKLKTGPVVPVADPGLSGAAGRNPAMGQSVSVLGLGMALAKFLAGKKAEKRMKAKTIEQQKKRLAMNIIRQGANGEKREIPIVLELRVE
jgi:hypothetical protein